MRKTNGITPRSFLWAGISALGVVVLATLLACQPPGGPAPESPHDQTAPKVETPQFSPTDGTYPSTQSVTLSTPTAGATICYSVNTTTLTNASPKYDTPVPLAGKGTTVTIRAYAWKTGMTDSDVAAATYIIDDSKVSTPQFAPVPDTYHARTDVTITSTPGASIYYTIATGGATPPDPDSSSTPYATITIDGPDTTKTIKAIALKSGMTTSTIATATYTVRYQYSLTVNATTGGSVSPLGATTVDHGSATAIAATANVGYAFVNWTTVSGTGVTILNQNSGSTTVTLTGGDATIQANFIRSQHQLTVQTGGNGSVVPSGTLAVDDGADTAIAATADAGYVFVNWTVESGTGVSFANANTGSTTVKLTGSDATIKANFTSYQHQLTAQSDGHGGVSPSGTTAVTVGADTAIAATPDSGYSFVNWTVESGTGVSFGNANSASTTVKLTTTDATIKAHFAQAYQLTVQSGGNGTVSPTGVQTAYNGSPVAITATPSTGYSFKTWTLVSGTGVTFGDASSSSTTVTLTNGNAVIRADFVLKQFQLTVRSGGNGTVTPAGTRTVDYNASTPITATPAVGYTFIRWTVVAGSGAGISLSTQASTSIWLTTGDVTVQADFALARQLTVQSGGNGTTSPSGQLTVGDGIAKSISATASSGYVFTTWTLISGGPVTFGNQTSFSTTVTLSGNDATIQANFLPTYKLTVQSGGHGTVWPNYVATLTSGKGYSISATHDTGYSFINWTVVSGTGVTFQNAASSSTQVTLSESDATIQANFAPTTYQLTTVSGANGQVSPSGTQTVGWSVPTSIAATPDTDCAFANWTIIAGNGTLGDSASASTTITLTSVNATVRGNFGSIIERAAGTGTAGFSGDGFGATAAMLNDPQGLVVDSHGNVYISDTGNNRIRKVDSSGNISTVAGNGSGTYSGDGVPATQAALWVPKGIAVDGSDNLYIADYLNHRIRKVDAISGYISTVAGGGIADYMAEGETATMVDVKLPMDVAVDVSGNIYITDAFGHVVRKVDTMGKIHTIAGNGLQGSSGDNGLATAATLYYPSGLEIDSHGNLYIADTGSRTIRKVSSSGYISTVAGGGAAFPGDGGAATAAALYWPWDIAVDSSGNMYFADTDGSRIRKVDTNGIITTVAGNGSMAGESGEGGAATIAALGGPTGLDFDQYGKLLFAEHSHRVRKLLHP